MRRAGLAIALGTLLVATGAEALTVTNLTYDASTIVNYPFTVETYGQTRPTPPGTSTSSQGFGGGDFSSFIENTGGVISFESSDVVSGLNVLTVSSTSLGF